MRNIFLLSLLAACFCACKKDKKKKDYSCNCTVQQTGTRTVRNQSAGFPPLIPASDQTTSEPINKTNYHNTSYHQVSKYYMYEACPTRSEKNFNESSVNSTANVFTLTTTEQWTEVYNCSIQ